MMKHSVNFKMATKPAMLLGLLAVLVSSCGPATVPKEEVRQLSVPSLQTAKTTKDAASQITIAEDKASDNITSAEREDNQTQIATPSSIEADQLPESDNETDLVGAIIWEIEQAEAKPDNLPDNLSASLDNDTIDVDFSDLIPTGPDPSLAEEALDAAFAMLVPKQQTPIISDFSLGTKEEGHYRLGVFLPRTGTNQIYGQQIGEGLEMALFQLANPAIELIYYDTGSDDPIEKLGAQALADDIDIAIGPLFSANAERLLPSLRPAMIPILSLSNNQTIAQPGLWVMGLVPEQQIDSQIAGAIAANYDEFAILSEQSAFGDQLTSHIVGRLGDFGLNAANLLSVNSTVSADDEGLIAALKGFTDYQPLQEDELIEDRPAPYDVLILAGGADFILKVAPLLSYYDLGPDRVLYLGTDLWSNPALAREPSLQGAFITALDPALSAAFASRHKQIYQTMPSLLSQLGFDVMAVAAQAVQAQSEEDYNGVLQNKVVSALVQDRGYSGYTGAFKLLPNGLNNRQFITFQLVDGNLQKSDILPEAF